MGWQAAVAIQLQAGNTIINANGTFVYSSAPALGNLVASVAPAAGTDQFGNAFVAGITSYVSATDYLQITSDVINLFKAGLFQGQQLLSTGNAITQLSSGQQSALDSAAAVICESAAAAGGSSTIALSAALTQIVNALTVGGNATITGTLSVNGSTSTGNGSNGGVTSGPSGTVNSFPAAGPNHTHAEIHTHPL